MDEAATASPPPPWNPLEDWKKAEIDWIRVDIDREELKPFMARSDLKGLAHALGFLGIVAITGAISYIGYARGWWVLMVIGLYLHGSVYSFFGDAIHELSHNTVFKSLWLSRLFTWLFGWLDWPWNPYFYRASHFNYHHRYTLFQRSDGEDTPNYVQLTPRLMWGLFLNVFRFKALVWNVGRLLTLRPASNGWRGRGYALDTWEQFILQNASDKELRQIHGFARFSMIGHVLFAALCLATGHWFLLVLITLAPFYGPGFPHFLCSTHQHVGCDANERDFKKACGSTELPGLLSFLYWRMEYHLEHHMYAGIPCYNLRRFSNAVADQLPPREPTIPRLKRMHDVCREKFGSWQEWHDNYGRFKGF